MNQRLIVLRGYPGSGKTTVGKELASRNIGKFIDHNQILTFLASIVGDDDGIYDEIHVLERAMARKILKSGQNVIVARGFSSEKSLESYLQIAIQVECKTLVVRLEASEEVLKKRIATEERKQDFNPTINEKALLDWVSKNPLEPVNGELIIDASKPVAEITEQIIKILK